MGHRTAAARIVLLLGVALIVGCGFGAPGAPKVYRIGYLTGLASVAAPGANDEYALMKQAIRERGYAQGQNVTFEPRFAEGNPDRLPGLAAELVALKPDVILVYGNNVALNVKQATSTIPVVVWSSSDPVDAGVVTNLAHPGGNITAAASASGPEVVKKRLQLFKETVPAMTRLAYLYDADPSHVRTEERAHDFALDLGIQFLPLQVRTQEDFAAALDAALRQDADGLFVSEGALIGAQRNRILAFANSSRLPAMFTGAACEPVGCLLGYAEKDIEIWRRVADYVDRILKGASPGDLPITPSAKLDLVINLKTAAALGITIPRSILDQATEVIQ